MPGEQEHPEQQRQALIDDVSVGLDNLKNQGIGRLDQIRQALESGDFQFLEAYLEVEEQRRRESGEKVSSDPVPANEGMVARLTREVRSNDKVDADTLRGLLEKVRQLQNLSK